MTKLIVNGKTISKSEKDCPLKLVVREGETATVELSVSSEDIEKALVRAYYAKTNKSKYPDFALTRDMRKEIEKLLQAPVKEEKEMIEEVINCDTCLYNGSCPYGQKCAKDDYKYWKPIPKEEKELIQAKKDGEKLADKCLNKVEEKLNKENDMDNRCKMCGGAIIKEEPREEKIQTTPVSSDSKKDVNKEEKELRSYKNCVFVNNCGISRYSCPCKKWRPKENRPEVDWEGLIRTIKDCSLDLKVSGMLIALIRIVKSIHERDK